jgi:hypothetical protein
MSTDHLKGVKTGVDSTNIIEADAKKRIKPARFSTMETLIRKKLAETYTLICEKTTFLS